MTLDKAALDRWIVGTPKDELCPDCRGDDESCCCQDEDDGPDPDDVRDRRIEREMEDGSE